MSHCPGVHSLFILSPAEGHPGGFPVFAIMSNAATNTSEQVFAWTCPAPVGGRPGA